jgi:hypothetical protein
MQDTFGLDLLSDLKEGTTRSNSCIGKVFGRNVDRLTCVNYVSYFSYHRPILTVLCKLVGTMGKYSNKDN